MTEAASQQSLMRNEFCSASVTRRVAAMLDLPTDALTDGAALPRGWHFVLMGADTPRASLRADGFPGLGAPLPNLGLPRLLQGGRSVMYHHEIPIGAPVTRTSGVAEITEKTNSAGRKAIVKIAHSLQVTGESEPAITETQTYVLLPAQPASQSAGHVERADVTAAHKKVVTPDETMLFQYSALGFNSHKIHLDRNYARDVEGFPDLVVNGGLTTLLLTEFARRELSLNLSFFTMKNLLPLFCGRPVTLTANRIEERWSLKAHDEFGRIAAEMEAQSNEL